MLNLPSSGSFRAPQQLPTAGEKVGTKYKVALEPGHSAMDWSRLSKSPPTATIGPVCNFLSKYIVCLGKLVLNDDKC